MENKKISKPELSCIIITLNEEKCLPKLLNSLKKQTFKNFEIIVADFNSKDKTRKIAKKYGCKVTIGGKPSVARNNGAKIARGKYLVFLDADSILQKNFIEVNFNKFKDSKAGAGSVLVTPLSNKIIDKILFKIYNTLALFLSKFSPHGTGACMFIRRDIFKKIKGFNEKIVFAEDFNLFKRAKKYGGFILLPLNINISVRRLEKDGRLKFAGKLLFGGLYRLFYKEIEKDLFDYI